MNRHSAPDWNETRETSRIMAGINIFDNNANFATEKVLPVFIYCRISTKSQIPYNFQLPNYQFPNSNSHMLPTLGHWILQIQTLIACPPIRRDICNLVLVPKGLPMEEFYAGKVYGISEQKHTLIRADYPVNCSFSLLIPLAKPLTFSIRLFLRKSGHDITGEKIESPGEIIYP